MKTQKTLKEKPLKQSEKVKIKVVKAIAGMAVGDTRIVPKYQAEQSVKNGWAVIIQEKKEVVKKETTEKPKTTTKKKK